MRFGVRLIMSRPHTDELRCRSTAADGGRGPWQPIHATLRNVSAKRSIIFLLFRVGSKCNNSDLRSKNMLICARRERERDGGLWEELAEGALDVWGG